MKTMSQRSTRHDTFTIERHYPVPPERVFDAFADQAKKARWFGCVDGWEVAEHTIDFRIGGREVWRGGPPTGTQHRNDTVYHDIVPNERIVWRSTDLRVAHDARAASRRHRHPTPLRRAGGIPR